MVVLCEATCNFAYAKDSGPVEVSYSFHLALENPNNSKELLGAVRRAVRQKYPTFIDYDYEIFLRPVRTVIGADGQRYEVGLRKIPENLDDGGEFIRLAVGEMQRVRQGKITTQVERKSLRTSEPSRKEEGDLVRLKVLQVT